jgi:hypothetical protein
MGYYGHKPTRKELLDWLRTQDELCAAHCVFKDSDMFHASIEYLTQSLADYGRFSMEGTEPRHKVVIEKV